MKKILASALLVALLVQTMAFSSLALFGTVGSSGGSSSNGETVNGIGKFDSDELIAQLKKDFLGSINKDLISKIEDYQLKGETEVIITFSDNALIDVYNASSSKVTFAEYSKSEAAKKIVNDMSEKQLAVLSSLEAAGLIDGVKHRYTSIMDAAFVSTTYEQLEAICNFEGVERVVLSDTYLPAAVENPVFVYDTGIFNSSNVGYTGRGTVVAILDTGCDYTHSAFTTYQVLGPRYDRDGIAEKLSSLIAYSYDTTLEAREVYYGNITGGKIAFGYDYADKDPDIMPFGEGHGTHVAGIIGGYDDTIKGVAIDTQFAIMKVFSDYDAGAKDGDILAALEDAILLEVDAINMSLGSSCGFSREADNDYKNEVFDKIEATGISLVVAAGNDYSSGMGGEEGNTNKTDNPDSATVGAPASYESAFTVASINGSKEKYMFANGELTVFFKEAYNQSAKEYDFFEMLGISASNPKEEIAYVTVPGYGYAINYSGIDVTGKIALVSRGDITFEEKVQFAYEAGARAIIIYNNVFGDISINVGNNLKIPVISIGKDEGDAMAELAEGKIVFDYTNLAGPFMSDFSSWGPTPDLHLKPEITAHGGNILSALPGGEYEEMSGTSMAAPNMTGIVVLIRQYVKEKYPTYTATQVRDLVNQLCMSTATIALDKKGNPYSPRKQGAGIADISKSTTTPAYLFVEKDGVILGKTKLELGDDPTRSGVYTMTVNIANISDGPVSYRVGNITMTESVSSSEPEYVAEMAYMLSNTSEYSVKGGSFDGSVVTVAAGESTELTVTLKLSDKDKSYLNSTFANGMYVEGYLTFDNVEENGVDLNAPFLAFYGDWGEAPIFDLDYYEVETEAHNNAIDDDDKIKADYYATTPMGSYYYDYVIPLGSYVYELDESEYPAIPATSEHAAISYYADSISGIYGVFTGLLRGAKELNISIINTATGEVVWSETQYNCPKAHVYGSPQPYSASFNLPAADYKTGEVLGNNNVKFEVVMSAKLDWDGEERNSSDTYSFSFYIDYEAPTVVDASFRTVYDKTKKQNRYYADVWVYDNHYAMSIRPIIAYEYFDEKDQETKKTYSALIDDPIPVYQENRGETTKVTIEITDYLDIITSSIAPEGLTLYIDDYAMNAGVAYIPFPETENDGLEFSEEVQGLTIDKGEYLDLSSFLVYKNSANAIEPDYLRGLEWKSSDESVVVVDGGRIQGVGKGTATISVTGSTWKTKTESGEEIPLYKNLVVEVTGNDTTMAKPQIEALAFVSYETLFAFSNDIDYSKIGITGAFNYFGGNNSITFYPSEQVKLNYNLEPWNLTPDRYTLTWTSSNPRVASVDENGVVTAQAEGSARISLQISVDGKTSLLAARCSITVKSEFIIENRTLIAYKGWGGVVEIPDDEGILTIGAFAFSHFDLDNEMEVEKDENGYYDLDLKKTPYGNKNITKVIVPEGVETIEKYAFYNSEILESVVLPESCKKIEKSAFENCSVLKSINLDNVTIISDYSFYKCESLVDVGSKKLSHVYAVGDYAFAGSVDSESGKISSGARFESLELTNLSRIGKGAFAYCQRLSDVTLGKRTRISEEMFMGTPIKELVVYSDIVSDYAFTDCESLESVILKNDLTYLGMEAFAGCSALSEIVFEGACEKIASFAFFECSSLEKITLPDCEIEIGDGAFASSAIKKIVLRENTVLAGGGFGVFDQVKSLTVDCSAASDRYTVEGNALYAIDENGKPVTLILLIPGTTQTTFTVPASVSAIADGAFSSNTSLTTVNASASRVSSIGYGAFAYCTSLRSVSLPSGKLTVGSSAFLYTSALKSIDLSGAVSIGELAFEESAITSVDLSSENVTIGTGAFYFCTGLTKATIGAGATIGEYAFAGSALKTVEIKGGGVTVSNSAFSGCEYLTSFDFDKIVGMLGDFAFYGCRSLKSVNLPEITEIGTGCFADCYMLKTFTAPKLEVIGDYAFAAYAETSPYGATFSTISAPNLKKIGIGAFYMCKYLESIDLSAVTEIGSTAFALCESLKEVKLSKSLTELTELVFYECYKLSGLDLSGIVRFGRGCLYGVILPSVLELPNAEYIGSEAFVEGSENGSNNLTELRAPRLTYIGDQAFLGCYALKVVYAPALKEIGSAAFAYTAIEEFEVFESLTSLGTSVFEGCESFSSFFTTDKDGSKLYDAEYAGIMIKNGVLYTVRPDGGYTLEVYPAAKAEENKTFEVAPGTVRIEYCAAIGNKLVETVVLPDSLRYIGNHAFYNCDNLKTVVFKSYYAPVLEGTLTGDQITINTETLKDYPGFDKLYKYDYYFRIDGSITAPYYYNTFIGTVASAKAAGLTYVIPETSSGYDMKVYTAYFTAAEDESSGTAMGPYAIAFIDAVNKLPDPSEVDRFDVALIEAAINAYNALEGRSDEAFVDAAVIEKFNKAHSNYNVSVVENLIAHLFDIDNSEYSFNLVKEARAAYLALTEAEKASVENALVLENKISDLCAVMGLNPDFSLTYGEHFPTEETPDEPDEPQDGTNNPPEEKDNTVLIIALVAAGAAVVATAAVLLVVFMKKKARAGALVYTADDDLPEVSDANEKED